jgi:hypothetical protein
MDDLAIAFAMRCDDNGLTYEAGVEAADRLTDEILQAAEDRKGLAPEGGSE